MANDIRDQWAQEVTMKANRIVLQALDDGAELAIRRLSDFNAETIAQQSKGDWIYLLRPYVHSNEIVLRKIVTSGGCAGWELEVTEDMLDERGSRNAIYVAQYSFEEMADFLSRILEASSDASRDVTQLRTPQDSRYGQETKFTQAITSQTDDYVTLRWHFKKEPGLLAREVKINIEDYDALGRYISDRVNHARYNSLEE